MLQNLKNELVDDGKPADSTKEYVLVHDYDLVEGVLIPRGTVVTVTGNGNDKEGYLFKLADGREYRTNYPWMLGENTPENLQQIEFFHQIRADYISMKKLLDRVGKRIKDLRTM